MMPIWIRVYVKRLDMHDIQPKGVRIVAKGSSCCKGSGGKDVYPCPVWAVPLGAPVGCEKGGPQMLDRRVRCCWAAGPVVGLS